jgi:hypothetical protein
MLFMINTLFEVTRSFTDEPGKTHKVHVVIPAEGKVIEKTFKFERAYDADILNGSYSHQFRKHPETILEFHEETVAKYEANELQHKMKV